MIKWLAPLWAFIIGMVLLLCSTIFYPGISTALTGLDAQTSSYQSHYWGLTWAIGSGRLLLFIIGLLVILFDVAYIWYKRR